MADKARVLAAQAGTDALHATRVFGLGSPHGDDQVGWMVVQRLAKLDELRGRAARLRHPADLLDHLDGCRRLILVDACRSGAAAGSILRFEWPDPRLEAYAGRSTHGLSVGEMLRLATSLHMCPRQVVLFSVEIADARPETPPCQAIVRAVDRVAADVAAEVGRGF